MPKETGKQAKQVFAPTVTASAARKGVSITVRVPMDVFARVQKARKELGLISDPELLRVALGSFLAKSGF